MGILSLVFVQKKKAVVTWESNWLLDNASDIKILLLMVGMDNRLPRFKLSQR
jgi:hypothetical protein